MLNGNVNTDSGENIRLLCTINVIEKVRIFTVFIFLLIYLRDNVKNIISADVVKRKTPPAICSTKAKSSEVCHLFSKSDIHKKIKQ